MEVETMKCGHCQGRGEMKNGDTCVVCCGYGTVVVELYECPTCGMFDEEECDQTHVVMVHDKDGVVSVSEYDDICCPKCGKLFDLDDQVEKLIKGQ